MKAKDIERRWLKFNIRGEGKRKSTASVKRHYTGPIFYLHGWPMARLVMLPNGRDYACLVRHSVYASNPPEWKDDSGPRMTDELFVPDVGAFSKYDGDWLPDGELHLRLHMLWHKMAAHAIEQMEETPWVHMQRAHTNLRWNIDNAAQQYERYGAVFNLGWGKFPARYLIDFDRRIADRRRTYESAKEVAKRERKVARAEAKIALGLTGEDK